MVDEPTQRVPSGFDVLRRNGDLVHSLWNAVDHCTIDRIPAILREVMVSGAWRQRKFKGKLYEHNSFLDFITTPPLAGCGWPPEKVEALIKDDSEVLAMWRAATTGKPGRPQKNSDIVTIKSERGNTRAYTLDRLKRERPDLFKLVTADKMSANAAAIKAGFRKNLMPLDRVLKLLPKLSPLDRHQIRQRLDEMDRPKKPTSSSQQGARLL